MTNHSSHLSIQRLNVWHGERHTLKDISFSIPRHRITAIVGPSGCGKTTLLKSMNRLIELDKTVRVTGQILLDGTDIYDRSIDVTEVRARIGCWRKNRFRCRCRSITMWPMVPGCTAWAMATWMIWSGPICRLSNCGMR
jgi:ABC-type phosphate transport system ATPase subunit